MTNRTIKRYNGLKIERKKERGGNKEKQRKEPKKKKKKVYPAFSVFPHNIFPDYVRLYLETSIQSQNFSEVNTFEQARLIGLELRRKQSMFYSVAEQLRSKISQINQNHISELKSKFICVIIVA